MMLTAILACLGSPVDSGAGANMEPYAVVEYDRSGLPICAQSVSAEAHCDGWSIERQTTSGHPEWADAYRPWGHVFSWSEQYQDASGFHCADSAGEVEGVWRGLNISSATSFTGVDEDDPRWFDAKTQPSSTGYYVRYRIPRCSYYERIANQPTATTPIWQVKDLPPSREHFLDQAFDWEWFRASMLLSTDYTRVYAVGSAGDNDSWTFRSCRINGRAGNDDLGAYEHNVIQTDYVMDVETGAVSYDRTVVRTVTCAQFLLATPTVW